MEGVGGYLDNFEFRLSSGSPMCSRGAPSFTVWVRFRVAPQGDATGALLALADALPPAAMAALGAPAPVSTATWAVDVAKIPAVMDGWHILRSESEHSSQGYSLQRMELWDATGTLLASGRQLVTIFA
jgi:acyl-CoA thioesterase